jgi:hypothetical protein
MQFSPLLQSLLKNIPTETVIRDFLIEYLQKNHTMVIKRTDIHVQKNTIKLVVSPIIKTKLLPHKEKILNDLNDYLKEKDAKMVIKNIM